jgi:hypothetical protein
MAKRTRKTGSSDSEQVRPISEAEAYVRQFCPRAEVRVIEPFKDHRLRAYTNTVHMTLPNRYFIGSFQGSLAVAIHSSSMQTPEDAWKDAQKNIFKYVLEKFES